MKVRTCVDCGEYKYIEQNGRCRSCSIPSFDVDSITVQKVVGEGEIAFSNDIEFEEVIADLGVDTVGGRGQWSTTDFKSPSISSPALTTFHAGGAFVIRSNQDVRQVKDEHQRIDSAVRSRTEADNAARFDISTVIAAFDPEGTVTVDRVEQLLSQTGGNIERTKKWLEYSFENHPAKVSILQDGTAVVECDSRSSAVLAIDALNDRLAHASED